MAKKLTYSLFRPSEEELEPFIPGLATKLYVEPEDQRLACVLVRYDPGFTLDNWCLYHNEVYIFQQGSATVTASFAPTFSETTQFTVSAGDVLYFPLGTKFTAVVTSNKPLVYLCVNVPSHLKV